MTTTVRQRGARGRQRAAGTRAGGKGEKGERARKRCKRARTPPRHPLLPLTRRAARISTTKVPLAAYGTRRALQAPRGASHAGTHGGHFFAGGVAARPPRTTRAAPSRAPRHPHCPVQSPRRHVSRLSARRAPVAGRTLEKGSDAPRWRFFTIKKTRAHPPARPHACYRTLHRCAPRAAGSEE